jgi:hypothetical protein
MQWSQDDNKFDDSLGKVNETLSQQQDKNS